MTTLSAGLGDCWHSLYAEHGLTGVVVFNHKGSESHLTSAQEAALFEWVRATLSRDSAVIGAWVAAANEASPVVPPIRTLDSS